MTFVVVSAQAVIVFWQKFAWVPNILGVSFLVFARALARDSTPPGVHGDLCLASPGCMRQSSLLGTLPSAGNTTIHTLQRKHSTSPTES